MSIESLVEQLIGLSPHQNHRRMRFIQDRLRSLGSPATDAILSVLTMRRVPRTHWSYLLDIVRHTAQPRHASTLVQLLFRGDVRTEEDRSRRCSIVETLGKIGDQNVVASLVTSLEYVQRIKYPKKDLYYLRTWDKIVYFETIKACQSRSSTEA